MGDQTPFGSPLGPGRSQAETPGRPALEVAPALEGLRALRSGLALRDRGTGDLLVIRGADRVDLLQRLCASDVRGLQPGQAAALVFTNDKGRIVDLAVAAPGDDRMWLLAGEGRGAALAQWIERYVILEDVQVERQPDAVALLAVGDGAAEVVAGALGCPVPQPGGFAHASNAGALLLREPAPWSQHLHAVALHAAHAGELARCAAGAVRERGGAVTGERAYLQWCIEHGRLRPGPELGDTLNPLEAGLAPFVSFTKGCYIGQEVVARLANYDKVRRRRVLVSALSPAPAPGDELLYDGRATGWIAAAVERIDGPGAVALALVNKEVAEGTTLTLSSGAQACLETAFEP
jgi:folate-binding protein YgfZ